MKKYSITCFFVLATAAIYAQYAFDWEKQFGGSFYEFPSEIIATSDGGYLVAGASQSDDIFSGQINEGFYTEVYLIRLSKEGDLIWQNVYGGSDHDNAYTLMEVSDGYVFSGYTFSDDGDISSNIRGNDNWVVKLNYEGEIIWEKIFPQLTSTSVRDILDVQDGTYALLGFENLFLISGEGDFLWSKANTRSTELIKDDDGNFITAGLDDRMTILNKFSSTGELIWQKEYLISSDTDNLNALELLEDGYLIGGSADNNAMLVKTDFDGSIMWTKSIGLDTVYEEVYDFSTTISGKIIAVGRSIPNFRIDPEKQDLLLIELDSQGDIVFNEVYVDTLSQSGRSVIHSDDGGFVVASHATKDFVRANIAVLKFSQLSSSTDKLEQSVTVQLYPNPTSDILFITLEERNIGASYKIYSARGVNCLSGVLENSRNEVLVDQLVSGTYIAEINTKTGLVSAQFVIKQQ